MNSDVPSAGSRMTAVVTVGVLLVLVLFTWRVVDYMNQIRAGGVDLSSLAYTQSFTPLAKKPNAVPASGSLPLERADAYALGSDNAPLRIVEFADFGCPFSQESSSVVRTLAQKYGDKIRVEYRHFPLTDLHPRAEQAAEAAECAGAQGKFWEYHDKLYINQSDQSADALLRYAKEVNLDAAAFARCLSSGQEAAKVQADAAAGAAAGVAGTPTFFFNGVGVPGSIPAAVFERLILQLTKPT